MRKDHQNECIIPWITFLSFWKASWITFLPVPVYLVSPRMTKNCKIRWLPRGCFTFFLYWDTNSSFHLSECSLITSSPLKWFPSFFSLKCIIAPLTRQWLSSRPTSSESSHTLSGLAFSLRLITVFPAPHTEERPPCIYLSKFKKLTFATDFLTCQRSQTSSKIYHQNVWNI